MITSDVTRQGALPRLGIRPLHAILFLLFFCSGFCSLLYQIVWVRMAFAHFGIITPVLSVVISVFMLGLGIGSVLGGKWVPGWSRRWGVSPAYFYAAAEFTIGIGAFLVPSLFAAGEHVLLGSGEASSGGYLLLSALFITASILPWCVMMGATFPLMMDFVRQADPDNRRSFSFLYLANVVGAMSGAALTGWVLVELLGFRGSYEVASIVNFSIAVISLGLARRYPSAASHDAAPRSAAGAAALPARSRRWLATVLFTTGFTSLAMEVVWTRSFTYVLTTTIYAFAMVLTTYLLATWIGSLLYRFAARRGRQASNERLLGWICLFALLPVLLADPRLNHRVWLTLASIVPFCLALGYLTPRLIDDYAGGHPAGAGRSYAINIAGGILGPLVAAYLLLPSVGVRGALLLLALLPLLLFVWAARRGLRRFGRAPAVVLCFALLLFVGLRYNRSYEDGRFYPGPHEIRRDYTASAIAAGEGMAKQLLVNGIGITILHPVTKVMAHLPLAIHGHPQSGLVICFGMGTTFRAMHSWGIDTTAAELSRSVARSFDFFHADAAAILADANSHIVVDDGRRYLLRSNRLFDVITVDPPPPVEAAGSSLLYTKEFYGVAKAHLAQGGILAQWIPGAEDKITFAVARSLAESFPYVVAYQSIANSGYHFVASLSPIVAPTPAEFVARMPEAARRDFVEWNRDLTPEAMAESVLSRRVDLASLLPPGSEGRMVTDDRPYNEYFWLRRRGVID